MNNAIDELKSQNIVDFVSKTLHQQPKEKNGNFWFHSPNSEDKTPSLMVYGDNTRGFYDYSKGVGGSIIDFYSFIHGTEAKESIQKLIEEFGIKSKPLEFKKSTKRNELFEKFESFRMRNTSHIFQKFLSERGINNKFFANNSERIDEISREFGVCENSWISNGVFKDIVIFPCYDYDFSLVGCKLRRADNEKIMNVKSQTIKGTKTGIIAIKNISDFKEIIICEGECDYIILKILGFDNVIGNLGGAGSNIENIKVLCRNAEKIISFYDSDKAGQEANARIQKETGRNIFCVQFPNIDNRKKIDVNDLFRIGYQKEDFEKLINGAIQIQESDVDDIIEENEETGIIEKDDGYYTIKRSGDAEFEVRLTNFKVKIEDIIVYHNQGQDIKKNLELTLFSKTRQVRGEFNSNQTTFSANFSTKVRSLETSFSTYDMTNKQLSSIIRHIHKGVKLKDTISIDKIGFIPGLNIFTFDVGVVKDKKFFPYSDDGVVDIGEYKIKVQEDRSKFPRYQEDLFYDKDIKKDIINDFRYIFSGNGGDLVLGFLFSSLFVNSIKEFSSLFPILFVAGKHGSGKTSALQIALNILGLGVIPENFEHSTVFMDCLDISTISSLPLWRDEFINSKKTKELKQGILKSTFNRSPISKGTIIDGKLGSITYKPTATMILSGQESPNDDAVFSRCCLVFVNGNRQKENGESQFREISARSDKYGSIIREFLTEGEFSFSEMGEKYKKIFLAMREYLVKEIGIEKRILEVYLPVISGFLFFSIHILKDNFFKDEQRRAEWTKNIVSMIQEKKEEEEEQDIINDFFGVINNIYLEGYKLNFNQKFIGIQGPDVNVAFGYFYSLFKEREWKNQNRQIKQIDLKKYIINEYKATESTMRIFGGRTQRCLKFDSRNLPENLKIIVENYKEFLEDEKKGGFF